MTPHPTPHYKKNYLSPAVIPSVGETFRKLDEHLKLKKKK